MRLLEYSVSAAGHIQKKSFLSSVEEPLSGTRPAYESIGDKAEISGRLEPWTKKFWALAELNLAVLDAFGMTEETDAEVVGAALTSEKLTKQHKRK